MMIRIFHLQQLFLSTRNSPRHDPACRAAFAVNFRVSSAGLLFASLFLLLQSFDHGAQLRSQFFVDRISARQDCGVSVDYSANLRVAL
jgi:hypothetical protein